MPIVSIFIPVLNGAKTIGKSIESAQRQTIRDIEIVVVDDGSTDGTSALVSQYATTDPRVKLVTLAQNIGGAGASNTGIDRSTGEWVAVLDADDWYEPNRIEVFLKSARELNADVVCDNIKLFDHIKGQIVEQTQHGPKDRAMVLDTKTYFRRDNPLMRHSIGYIQPMVRKSFLTQHAIKYDTTHRYAYDFLFVADILLNGAKLVIVPGAYYTYVHRISPTTLKRSPHSRSEAGHKLIVRGCDELMERYGARMSSEEKAALAQRRYYFESRVLCGEMLDAVDGKQYLQAASIFAKRPFIGVLILNTVGKMIYANYLALKRRLLKYEGTPLHAV